jgi:predicted PurR-regulated permease PerM
VGLSPIIIILSILIGFEIGGIWGAALAIPLTIIIMEFLSDVEKDKIIARTQNR